jgi:hypothetical protein
MSKLLHLSLMCGLLSVSTSALAQTSRPTSQPAQKRKKNKKGTPARKLVAADQSEQNSVKLLTKMIWHSDLEKAKASAKKQKKLIFWIHAVGDLSDKL